jgi:peptide/nickel transport system permease protein
VLGVIVRRGAQAIVVLIMVSLVVFVLLHVIPGGLVRAQLGPRASRYAVHQLSVQEGLTKPLPVQYALWFSNVLHGNLGFAYEDETPVSTLIREYYLRTLLLGGLSLVLTVLVSIPLGIMQGARRNKGLDYGVSGTMLTVYSMPTFLLGVILILLFGIWLHILPDTATKFGHGFATDVKVLVLPVATLTIGNAAYFTRYVRSSVIDNLVEDYVRTAKAKGAGNVRILMRHVLRNSLLPLVSVVGLSISTVIGGALIVEFLFHYPGLGLLFWDAQNGRTFPLMLGILLIITAAVVVGNLVADLAYAVLDPRIRYD